jgi:hypothetical protein
VLDAAHTERIGLVDQVLPRSTFEKDGRRVARALSGVPPARGCGFATPAGDPPIG